MPSRRVHAWCVAVAAAGDRAPFAHRDDDRTEVHQAGGNPADSTPHRTHAVCSLCPAARGDIRSGRRHLPRQRPADHARVRGGASGRHRGRDGGHGPASLRDDPAIGCRPGECHQRRLHREPRLHRPARRRAVRHGAGIGSGQRPRSSRDGARGECRARAVPPRPRHTDGRVRFRGI